MQKDAEERQIAFSATIAAILGVTEPALYGVNLRLVRPMIAACIAGGFLLTWLQKSYILRK